MRPGGRDLQPLSFRDCRQLTSQSNHLLASSTRIVANASPELDDRLVQLGLKLLFQNDLAALNDLLDVRTQLARQRIDQLKFLFNTEGKDCSSIRRITRCSQFTPKRRPMERFA